MIAACEDPPTCPNVSPDEAGASLGPILSNSSAHVQPLQCAYLDSCGETQCTQGADESWFCKRNPDWDNCTDASVDAD